MSTKLAIEVSKESWKVSAENIKQGTKTALDVTKRSWDGVAGGATDAVVDTWNDLVHMVEDPKGTLQSIGEGAQAVWDDPKGVAKTIGNEIKDSWNEQVINGDAKSRGHYFSYLTANVAMSIVGTKGADKLAKTTKLEQLSGAATKKLNEGAAAINVRTQSALQNLGLNKLDNRLAYPGVGSVKGNGGYQFIERVDGGHGVGTKVRDEKVAEGTENNSSSKNVYGPYYDEAKKLHETNPDWYPDPDESTIVKGKELKELRADYQALVRRGELEKGHHVQGLSFGGENVSSNIKTTGESTIRREQIDDLNLDFYHEMRYGKENAKVLKIHENEEGIIVFGNNPQHTGVTVFQNKVLKWQRENGKR
ncbi:hypothetical protein [Priestia flexa]|uniref:hypothetical protein n=1 Tax=Priestia flexa TaxID=86664 RepID=UPI00288E69F8|nr:hypothetical protein [Priestia flexa]MDT2047719.1 hypothetical protein [Priestia flexa]